MTDSKKPETFVEAVLGLARWVEREAEWRYRGRTRLTNCERDEREWLEVAQARERIEREWLEVAQARERIEESREDV